MDEYGRKLGVLLVKVDVNQDDGFTRVDLAC